MGRSTEREQSLSEIRKYRKFTAQQKTEIVLASLRGPKTMAELCREHDIADSLLCKWRVAVPGGQLERPLARRFAFAGRWGARRGGRRIATARRGAVRV